VYAILKFVNRKKSATPKLDPAATTAFGAPMVAAGAR